MAQSAVRYADEISPFYYDVVYIVNATGAKLKHSFDSLYLAWKFTNKIKRSKKCTLVSYPNFQ